MADESSAREIARRVREGEVTAASVIDAHLTRATAAQPRLGAFTIIAAEAARARAGELDAALARGEDPGPLAGVPIAVKDNICTRGMVTTAASRILAGFAPPYSATVVERLEAAGAVVIGKTNLDEFGMGSSTENSGLHPARNPWDEARVPGGSSGGSAAAVCVGAAPLALGSDTGGSIRQPASLCGVTGLKPTYGRVSRFGLIAFASSLDQIGPFARDARDAALALDAIAGHDGRDATSADEPVEAHLAALEAAPERLEGMRVGLPREHLDLCRDDGVRAAVEAAVATLRDLGATVREVSLPLTPHGIACYQVISTAEASSNLARYDGVHYGHRAEGTENIVEMMSASRSEGFGAEVKRRIMLGTFVLSSGYYDAYYLRAQRVRSLIRRETLAALDEVDVLVGPTSPVTAFRLGERLTDPLTMYAVDAFTVGANLAGVPAVSAPCGADADGLPIGLQVTARPFREIDALRVVDAFQRATDHHARRPALADGRAPKEGSRG